MDTSIERSIRQFAVILGEQASYSRSTMSSLIMATSNPGKLSRRFRRLVEQSHVALEVSSNEQPVSTKPSYL